MTKAESVTVKKKPAKKKATKKTITVTEVPITLVDKDGKKLKHQKPPKKKAKAAPAKNSYVEEKKMKFEFRSKDGTLTSIPMTGKVNVVELRQANRTDYLFTRLPKELTLKYSPGRVFAKYDTTIGDCCLLATKYRGDAVDASKPQFVAECYTIIFCPHFGELSADLEHISEGIADEDIKHSILALDESKALIFRNKWLTEKSLREGEQDLEEQKQWSRRKSATRMATTITDDVDLGDRAVEGDVDIFNMGKIGQWLQKNWLYVLLTVLGILVIASFFGGG